MVKQSASGTTTSGGSTTVTVRRSKPISQIRAESKAKVLRSQVRSLSSGTPSRAAKVSIQSKSKQISLIESGIKVMEARQTRSAQVRQDVNRLTRALSKVGIKSTFDPTNNSVFFKQNGQTKRVLFGGTRIGLEIKARTKEKTLSTIIDDARVKQTGFKRRQKAFTKSQIIRLQNLKANAELENLKIKKEINRLKKQTTSPLVEKRIKQLEQLAKSTGEIIAEPKTKLLSLAGISKLELKLREGSRTRQSRAKTFRERAVFGIAVSTVLGGLRGLLSLATVVKNPLGVAKGLVKAAKTPRETIRTEGQRFIVDPVGVVTEFYIYNKALGLSARAIKRSPVARFIQEEIYIKSQPKQIRPGVRAIIKGSEAQKKLNPIPLKKLDTVPNFVEVKSLTKIEANALKKTLLETDSVVFGSLAARKLSKGRTPLPKDVDLATRSIITFNNKFINNLPKNIRKGYKLKGQKLFRLANKEALFDIKPLEKIVPRRSLLTGRGRLPVPGFVRKLKRPKGKILPRIVKEPGVAKFTVATQKTVKTGKIKLTGFGEQTTRKGLGTLQVLIERNARRAKDPQSFLIGLEVQRAALKRAKPLTPIGKIRNAGKIKTLTNSINVLKSRSFARLLDRKVPGLIKKYPLVSTINSKRLKAINFKAVKKLVAKKFKVARLKKKPKSKKIPKATIPSSLPKTIPKKQFIKVTKNLSKKSKKILRSRLPSQIPSRVPVRLFLVLAKPIATSIITALTKIRRGSTVPGKDSKPSKIPKRKPSMVPTKLPTKIKIPTKKSKVPSKLRQSVLSQLPPLVASKIGLSNFPTRLSSRLFIKSLPKNIKDIEKPIISKNEIKKLTKKKVKKSKKIILKFIFQADLISRLYGIKAKKKDIKKLLKIGRLFTGLERRPIITKKQIIQSLKKR